MHLNKVLFHIFQDIQAALSSLKPPEHYTYNKSTIFPSSLWKVKEFPEKIMFDTKSKKLFSFLVSNASKNGYDYLFSHFANCTLSFTVVKIQKEELYRKLKFRVASLQEQRFTQSIQGKVTDPVLIHELLKQEKQIESVAQDIPNYFVEGTALIDYAEDDQKIKLFAKDYLTNVVPNYFSQLPALKRLLFTNSSTTSQKESVTTLSTILRIPPNQPMSDRSIFLGHEKISQQALFEDFFHAENFNSLILAKSGAGKTFLAKMLIKRLLFSGIHVIILDPENEYQSFCEQLGGENRDATSLEAFDAQMIQKNDLNYLENMLPLLFSNTNDLETMQLLLKQTNSYEAFFNELDTYDRKYIQKITTYMNKQKKSLFHTVQLTNFPIQSDNLSISLYKIIQYALHSSERTILFIDEAHKVLDDIHIAHIIRQAVKRGRKHSLGICLISQDIGDFVQNKWSKAIIANATYTFLLKQEPINLPLIKEIFSLGQDADLLLNASIGEGIYIHQRKSMYISFDPF